MTRGLLDTSIFVATESGRSLDRGALPEHAFVSVVTVAELQAGVLAARDVATRARRLATADRAALLTPLPIDGAAATAWATMRAALYEAGRRVNVNDLWIAAVARANDMPVVTQDAGFDALADLGMVEVVKV
ncbi:ribonuclease VapC [Nocardioides baekrokdamisoli]|uniref:Ribonuclease VapC n=1 Tax=Nocardioides baekrokdamisoli TaxID=1804624 RepID=A0A3G9IZT6_9ACTN|nr:type II toxin-antitoxin system VapC family toxin [Nocardioides baekrokdamisoli]BBH16714.1 ribonuclease VapC [Nocardioides baekrokdamisoli]